MSHGAVPDWLSRALMSSSPPRRMSTEELDVQEGDIRLAQPMDGPSTGERRPVLVLAVHDTLAEIALTTPEVDLAGHNDVRLDHTYDDLPFSLTVELDAVGPVLVTQLGEPLGRVAPGFVERLNQAPVGGGEIESRLRGLPVVERTDPRWSFKRDELAILDGLARHARRVVLEGEAPVVDPAVWARVFHSSDVAADPAASRLALAALGPSEPLDPAPAVLKALEVEWQGLHRRLGREVGTLVARHFQRGLRTTPANESPNMLDLDRETHSLLAAALGVATAKQARAVELRTTASAWQNRRRHERVDTPNGAIQITSRHLEVH
jgi:hypothetical protein